LPPAANRLLRELGLMDRFVSDGHLPCYGNQGAWSTETLHATDFLSAPDGHGWHIDRTRFDDMLRTQATAAGAVLAGPATPYEARWLVDCTGRASAVARSRGVRRRVCDTLTAFTALYDAPPPNADPDSLTTIEAVESGWWYTARLPHDRRLTVYYTDANSPLASVARTPSGYDSLLTETHHIAARLRTYHRTGPPVAMAANNSCLEQIAGRDWLAAGDAATAHDPLSSLGISAALVSGMRAADAIDSALAGNPQAVPRYAEWMHAAFDHYLVQCARHYAAEQRWPHSPFWSRRSSTREPSSPREMASTLP
jgi:flavin-dependent dehydrogenase